MYFESTLNYLVIEDFYEISMLHDIRVLYPGSWFCEAVSWSLGCFRGLKAFAKPPLSSSEDEGNAEIQ